MNWMTLLEDETRLKSWHLIHEEFSCKCAVLENATMANSGLTVPWCRHRQDILLAQLEHGRVDAILLLAPIHVYYFTGYLPASHHSAVMLLTADGKSVAVVPKGVELQSGVADEVRCYDADHFGTLVDNQLTAAATGVVDLIDRTPNLGVDVFPPSALGSCEPTDLSRVLLQMRRSKYPDELELIQAAVDACEAAYRRASAIVAPGTREIDIYAEMLAAATKHAGLPLGEMGNDFQAGTPGGTPRTRAVQAGELMPLDVSISYRGYRCDMCRTFAVDRQPTDEQQLAAQKVQEALHQVEQVAAEGVNCKALYQSIVAELDGYQGWSFPHHLGHGIGLQAHESPRLNPHWDDVLQVGDVFTVEPGLYHEQLKGGVRIEHDYWLSPEGLVRLGTFTTDLVPEVM